MTLAVCFQNLSRLLLLDTNFSNFSLPSVLEMKISWESSTGFPLSRPYCRSRFSLSISRASTGFLPYCTRKMEKIDVICSYLYIRWVGRNYSEELCLTSLPIFWTCRHRAAHTGSFWNWSWKPIVFTLWYRKRELFGLSLYWECFTSFIIMKSSKNGYCMPAFCVTIPFSFFFSHP